LHSLPVFEHHTQQSQAYAEDAELHIAKPKRRPGGSVWC
jgi:hypothetical protein